MIAVGTSDLVGLKIRSARIQAGETLADTARATGVSESLLSRIENGHRRASRELVKRLSSHFGVDAEELSPAPGERGPIAAPQPTGTETVWAQRVNLSAADFDRNSIVLAEIALSTATRQLTNELATHDHIARYRTCKELARLAAMPLMTLQKVSQHDDDPVVREAARQLLNTLLEGYAPDPT